MNRASKRCVTPENALFNLFQKQHSAAAIPQALGLGVARHRLDRMVRSGYLRRVTYGIVAPNGTSPTWEHRAMVGVLRCGYGTLDGRILAALFGRTAAALHGWEDKPTEIDVTTTRRVDPSEGYRFHRTSRLPGNEIVLVEGIPVTDPARTLLDVCDVAPHRARTLFYRAIRRGSLTPEELSRRCELEARRGRGGIALARKIVGDCAPGAEKAKSAREDEVYGWLVEDGLPAPERNFKICSSFGWDWEIDLFYPGKQHGIEVSPYWHHSDVTTYERDNLKTNDLASMGIGITKVTDETTREQLLRLIRPLFRGEEG